MSRSKSTRTDAVSQEGASNGTLPQHAGVIARIAGNVQELRDRGWTAQEAIEATAVILGCPRVTVAFAYALGQEARSQAHRQAQLEVAA